MAEPFPDPEQDLDRLRGYLEKGAETVLEPLDRFTSVELAEVTVERPGTVRFDITASRLLESIADDDGVRVLLDLGLGDLSVPTGFFVHLFLNNPEATLETTDEEPGFRSGLGFFCEPDARDISMACPVGDTFRINRLDVTSTLQEIAGPDDAISATIVVVPAGEEPARDAALVVRLAELSLVRSIVTIAS